MTRIAIDAMGGDHAPHEIVAGAVWAAYEYNVPIELVGKRDDIQRELDKVKNEGFLSDCGQKGNKKRIKIDTKAATIGSEEQVNHLLKNEYKTRTKFSQYKIYTNEYKMFSI